MGNDLTRWQLSPVNDYERIARIIRLLDEHHTEQPGLDDLAGAAGLSSYHFHRLFTRWAGVTPKEFLQCLTHTHARRMLCEGRSVLDAALRAGLSGPGRLHDLCVAIDAASPGEVKSGGQGMTVHYGFVDTPFGNAIIGESERGVCHLRFCESKAAALEELQSEWPNAALKKSSKRVEEISAQVFSRTGRCATDRPLRAHVRGSEFQLKVWRALAQIPIGRLVSYGSLAEAIGSAGAARAVGTAVGANPLAYLIPCHRVIRETGVIGQYRWGHERKQALIAWETAA